MGCAQNRPQQALQASKNIIRRQERQGNLIAKISTRLLTISNHESMYRLKYGQSYRPLLEARDQVLEHQFVLQYNLDAQEWLPNSKSLSDQQLYNELKKSIKDFLAEAVANVVSAGFKFLCNQELLEREAKNFSSKNIMINLQAIYRETIKTIGENEELKERVQIDKLKEDLIIQIDNILHNILINLSDNYPQALPSGGTPRMREVITEVNRVDDEQNDFIFCNKIKIIDHLTLSKDNNNHEKIVFEKEGDYTTFIMKVINAAIKISQDNTDDARARTIFQKFTEFSQHLFWISQQKHYQRMLGKIDHQGFRRTESKEKKRMNRKILCSKFDDILTNETREEPEPSQLEETQELRYFDRMWEDAYEGIAQMKTSKSYALGQKIPPSVKTFSKQDIVNQQFTAKHSSILRILTKWADYLEDIFTNPEQYVRRRLYSFKNIHDELVNLQQSGYKCEQGASKLVKRLKEEYGEIKKKFHEIMKVSYGYMGNILSKMPDSSFVSSVSRYTQTRTVTSKINAVLTSLMLNYTNLLIHHLLTAGEQIMSQNYKYHNINLVHFRVSDLMRSKLQCNQASFISVLKTIYLLDNSEVMRGKFKLVRIKNKLDEPANNILINYLFMGKVQCELQLSIQEEKGKQKNSQIFSHFLYELTRGKFGSIAECSIMISQLDPMITACKHTHYLEKEQTISLAKEEHLKLEPVIIEQNKRRRDIIRPKLSKEYSQTEVIKSCIFECIDCGKLITNEHPEKYASKDCRTLCYRCIINRDPPEDYLRSDYRKTLNSMSKHQLKDCIPLTDLKSQKCAVCFGSSGEFTLQAIIYMPKEYRTFMLKIDNHVLRIFDSPGFDYSTLDYIDISKIINRGVSEGKPPPVLTYLYDQLSQLPQDVLEKVNIDQKLFDNIEKRISAFLMDFKQFRHEKNAVKTLKFKAQIIRANRQEWSFIDKVCKVLVLQDHERPSGLTLKYKKYKHLDVSNLKQITANQICMTALPIWMSECNNLKYLELNQNQLAGTVDNEELPPSLTHISLWRNALESLDISKLHNLKSLVLSGNKLTHFSLQNNNNLQKLYLSYNKLTSFDFGRNKTITKLYLSSNRFTSFDLGHNTSLEYLDLQNNQLISFELTPQCRLSTLYLNDNQLTLVSFGENKTLRELSLHDNWSLGEVRNIPASLEQLKADRQGVIRYDFRLLPSLRELSIFNEQTRREELMNLREQTNFTYCSM